MTTYKIDPGLVAPRIIQSAIGVDRQLPKNITLSVNYTIRAAYTNCARSTSTRHCRALIPAIPGVPNGQRESRSMNTNPADLFKQNQLSANINARLNARYSIFGYYSLGHAHSNTDGVNTFPVNTYDQSTEWSRAQFDVRNRAVMGGNITAPFGIRLNPFLLYASAAPFNIVVGQDLNGDTITNDRPSLCDCRRSREQQCRSGRRRASLCIRDSLWSSECPADAGRGANPPQFRKWLRQLDHQHARQPDLGLR